MRMLPPSNMAIRQLSREKGISEATLHKWRAVARGSFCPTRTLVPRAGPKGWSQGLVVARQDRGSAGDGGAERGRSGRILPDARPGQATKEAKKRVKDLERDLARKEKALAETAVALIDTAVTAAGVRRANACAELQISDRTLRR